MWKASGGELFNQFVDVSRWDKYGSWGALSNKNPKYQGLMDFIKKILFDQRS